MSYAAQVETGSGVIAPIGSTLYGICSTAANVAEKIVVLPKYDTLLTGTTIHVKFTNGNTAAAPTLTVGSTEAKPIYVYGTVAPGSTAASSWAANSMLALTYDGTAWRMNDIGFSLWEVIYPVGAIYMSVNSTSPATLFGGTWSQIKDKFLLSAGTTYSAGSSGGAATVTLTANNLPTHTHPVAKITNGTAGSAGAHTHPIWYSAQSTARTWGFEWHEGGTPTASADGWGNDSAGAHTHTVTIPAHNTGNNTTTGTAVDKMPPYLAVYVWKRVS